MRYDLICLNPYLLWRDMCVWFPKTILAKLPVESGKTGFKIYLDKKNAELPLKRCSVNMGVSRR